MYVIHGIVLFFAILVVFLSASVMLVSIIYFIVCYSKIHLKKEFFVSTLKRIFLFPSELLRCMIYSIRGYRPYLVNVTRAILLCFCALTVCEAITWTGVDTDIDSYFEYPYSKSGYCLMVNYEGDKYYKLPAQIVFDGRVHRVTRTWWPNGDYIDFSKSEGGGLIVQFDCESKIHLQERNYNILLLRQGAIYERIVTTKPALNDSFFTCCIAAFLYFIGSFPMIYPTPLFSNIYHSSVEAEADYWVSRVLNPEDK